jgi:hypothetical protein
VYCCSLVLLRKRKNLVTNCGPTFLLFQRSFFNAEDYSKRLLGNSFSIPVVEYLLTRLSEVFATREYEGFDYNYRWETDETE